MIDSKSKPLVMAWIGEDDPHRGDSKLSIGLAQRCAELLDGQYVYVDSEMLEKLFPKAKDHLERMRNAIKHIGEPDILIGPACSEVYYSVENRPTVTMAKIGEAVSNRYGENKLIPHNLTNELLEEEGAKFRNIYTDIKGPLVALMVANDHYDLPSTARKLTQVAKQYDEVTFFICPSRRTANAGRELEDHLNNRLSSVFNTNNFSSYLKRSFDFRSNINVISADYKESIAGYNPYLGLLANADHIVISGISYSMVSEALFTGKNIHIDFMPKDYMALQEQGYIVRLDDLSGDGPFETRKMKALNVTDKIANMMVDHYKAGRSVQL